MWWCPAGPLALLPLHATGHHDTRFEERPETVIDRVVSSSTPTVRALLHSRQPKTDPDGGRLLVVAMPDTPGQPGLPGAEKEAELVTGLFAGQVDVLGLPDTSPATFATVTAALPNHRWAHFSCHGASDLNNPSASHLLLTDYQKQPLTVLDLTHARLENVELAFLSACTTARTGATLPDEPIHLAAACQLAGYQHVIATLWPISDTDAARITKHVYTTLTSNTNQLDSKHAATALHTATRQLRPLYPQQPSRWAPYTHTGP
jgi:CHAT domain-containing protein